MAKTPSGKEYKLVSVEDQGIQCCYLRGFMPVFDNKYVDAHLIEQIEIGDHIVIIPEIEEEVLPVIHQIVDSFEEHFNTEGNLPGLLLQNMGTWIVAWAIEMAWCWSEDMPELCAFSQDMDDFEVPMDKFKLVTNEWISGLITAFMWWCFNNPGYTDRHEIDIYDPLRDGYLTITRIVLTHFLDILAKLEK